MRHLFKKNKSFFSSVKRKRNSATTTHNDGGALKQNFQAIWNPNIKQPTRTAGTSILTAKAVEPMEVLKKNLWEALRSSHVGVLMEPVSLPHFSSDSPCASSALFSPWWQLFGIKCFLSPRGDRAPLMKCTPSLWKHTWMRVTSREPRRVTRYGLHFVFEWGAILVRFPDRTPILKKRSGFEYRIRCRIFF